MEFLSPGNTTAYQFICMNGGSSTDPCNSSCQTSEDFSFNDLKACLNDVVGPQDMETSTGGFEIFLAENEMKDERKDLGETNPAEPDFTKCYEYCVRFPGLDRPKSFIRFSKEEKGSEVSETSEASVVNGCCEYIAGCSLRPIFQPTPLKLVSAMKGSRERRGLEPKKLSVSWASDVYDPIPTSVSHVPSSKNQHSRLDGKKHGKKKHKGSGKSVPGSKGKDKKHNRNTTGSTSKLRPLTNETTVFGFVQPLPASDDFTLLSLDTYCGSSFVNNSATNLHFPAAEAT